MSDLLYSWLNDEVQLSKKIVNFEADFANGFFFGELLSKYSQQLNFKEFENRFSSFFYLSFLLTFTFSSTLPF